MNVHRPTILVIDDEPGMRDMLAWELSQDGFEVETAESGMLALEAMRRRKFDLALTDLKMPGMDGAETLEGLRRIDPDIQVVVATGYATVETAVACMKRGAYDYIEKPYDLQELRHLLERAMEKSRLQGIVALYEASRALLGTLRHDDLLALVMDLACPVLQSDAIGLSTLDEAGSATLHTSAGTFEPSDARLLELSALSLAADQPLLLPQPGQAMPPELAKEPAVGSALVLPLQAGGRLAGHLMVFREVGQPLFSSSELHRGTVFAGQIALSMENARLYSELEDKMQELLNTQEQLVHAEKLALAAHFAGGVAHEVNNPLAIIRVGLDAVCDYSSTVGGLWLAAKEAAGYLKQHSAPEAGRLATRLLTANGTSHRTEEAVREIAEVIDESLEGVKRIADLLAGFQGLVDSAPEGRATAVSLYAVAEECARDVVGLGGAAIGLELSAQGAAEAVAWAAASDVKAALQNLFKFLAHEPALAAPSAPALRVELRVSHESAHVVVMDPTLQLDEEERLRIWDPRFHLDYERGRTMRLDLTLALAYQLIRRNDGQLTVDALEGGGTKFLVTLPLANESIDG